MIKDLFWKIWIWRVFYIRKNSLPTQSRIDDPKMDFDGLSQSFYWEDEGLPEAHYHLIQAFKHVTVHRTQLVVGPAQDFGFMRSKKFDKQIYQMAKKYFPDWIGFQESRCSYNPQLADRMMRIRKVADWRFQKLLDEDDQMRTAKHSHS